MYRNTLQLNFFIYLKLKMIIINFKNWHVHKTVLKPSYTNWLGSLVSSKTWCGTEEGMTFRTNMIIPGTQRICFCFKDKVIIDLQRMAFQRFQVGGTQTSAFLHSLQVHSVTLCRDMTETHHKRSPTLELHILSKVSNHIVIIKLILVLRSKWQKDDTFNNTFMMILISIELF